MGCQAAAPSAAGCISVPLQGLPLAAPLLLQLLLLRIQGRTIVCRNILLSPGLKLVTTPLALANEQLSLLVRAYLTRSGQDSVAASLSIVRMLIRSSDKDLWQTGRTHPDCPCPPIAVLQPHSPPHHVSGIRTLQIVIEIILKYPKSLMQCQ